MLLVRATSCAGARLLIIGLSDENRRHLDTGDPIEVNTIDTDDGALTILIFGGKTEDSMHSQLSSMIDVTKGVQ